MSRETKKKQKYVKKISQRSKSYKFGEQRYFNANKSINKKTPKKYYKQTKQVHKKTKPVDKEVDLYQSHLPETAGYIDTHVKASEELEKIEKSKTLRLTQEDILQQSDLISASKRFELTLPKLGPYNINYSRSGRYLLIGGNRGHIASIDWMSKKLTCEFQLKETVRDVQYLHNENMFAVAQKK
ncbi:U3 small nucleolar RNA-associated protein 7 [Oopsacas minuta]|uniref:U3 small nucleolar RNA-associated protein 7 n=1 Tax=Oopsacas minuta TaxID=111878 RepID=A0AAV7JTD4_9METZ|nr:U3 small nucleolar RNA-associated protein 7 [Oopsacas minuta]